jgi:hypothetical protein
VQVERWQRAHTARPDQQHLSARVHAGISEILASWQYGYALIPLGLLGIVLAWRQKLTWFLGAMLLALTLFWLFVTHLEGRFFVLALPICGWLIAQIDRPALCAVSALLVLFVAGISGVRLHHEIAGVLQTGRDLLGVPDLGWVEADYLDGLPSGADVVLIGDAKAFFYTIPMSQLHYRTVFDVHGGDGDLIWNWNDGPIPRTARVIVDPPELKRFHDTYWKIPETPAWVLKGAPKDQAGRAMPFIVTGPHS